MQRETRIPLHTLNNKGASMTGTLKDSSSNITATVSKNAYAEPHPADVIPKSSRKSATDEIAANKEYILTLKNALREVIEENEMLRERVKDLEDELSSTKSDLELKENALLELAEIIENKEEKTKKAKKEVATE